MAASLYPVTVSEFNKCVEQHADGVYRFILHQNRNAEDARDIVQESFEKMWHTYAEVSFEKSKSYLFTTAYRSMIDHIRRKRNTEPVEQADREGKAEHGHYTGLKELLRQGLDRLPEIQKSVVLLRDYEGYSYEEIGHITGLNASQVKVYIYRARTSLKEYIGKPDNVI